MAYSTSNPPNMLSTMGGGGFSIWHYDSADAATTVRATNYITNADELGMKVGDMVIQTDRTGATVAQLYIVVAVTSSGADLSNGTAVSVTNT